MNDFNPRIAQNLKLVEISQKMQFGQDADIDRWQANVKSKLVSLLGETPDESADLCLRIADETENRNYTKIRFIFSSEEGADVPCYLLIPSFPVGHKYPVMICLQGHTSGAHISLGETKFEGDEEFTSTENYAIQAVEHGYAALAIEQRCFGERRETHKNKPREVCYCHHSAMAELLMGRTLIGMRIWEISRAIDCLKHFPMVDMDRISCIGNSGGGTAAYYASCMDNRIKTCIASCSVSTYESSIARIYHCVCNYIPGIYKFFEMGDLACLIAPRQLIIVAGRHDEIFPIDGVKKNYRNIENIYKACNAAGNCCLIIGEGGHQFYPDLVWPLLM